MRKQAKKTVVVSAPAETTPAYRKVAVFAAVGLVIGLAWPSLAGVRIGPQVPGAKKGEALVADVDADGDATTTSGASRAAGDGATGVGAASARVAASAEPGRADAAQLDGSLGDAREDAAAALAVGPAIVVTSGVITACHDGKTRLDGDRCGKLRIDRLLVPKFEALASCPSALGLEAELEFAVELDFIKRSLRVSVGGKTKLPNTTTNGITSCLSDYVRDIDLSKLAKEHDRYLVRYGIEFAPARSRVAETAAGADAAPEPIERDLGVVLWDTALVRDEPRTGKVVARVVRGTRVKIIDSRKEWLEVKIGNKQGWIYRAALGR
ncbi:MAG: SH3 domain-containing protein [Myxococcales bacterium]|nr:SH3 domain-containing protein [Myxococcales bacterium]